MAKIVNMKFGIADKVFSGSYESVNPMVELEVEVGEDENPDTVAAEMTEKVGVLWERSLCQRMYVKIEQHQLLNGPPLDPWFMRLYEHLRVKHYGDARG